jgi:hypothetical protein
VYYVAGSTICRLMNKERARHPLLGGVDRRFHGEHQHHLRRRVRLRRSAKEWLFIPALLLLARVVFAQRRRMMKAAPAVQNAAVEVLKPGTGG